MSSNLLFGLDVPPFAGPGADPVGRARAAESLGLDFVSTSDHPCGTDPSYETWTMLSWIAARTTKIRVATRVLGIPYRPPAMVAKMAETLDRLSGGRLILGLGGGYSDDEFRAFGLGSFTPRDKVDGMDEAIRIAHGLWSAPSFTFEGRLYHTSEAAMEPKPARPIPIWLGTYGNRALRVTGRLADGWIPSLGLAPPSAVPAMRARIDAAARDAGRDPASIRGVYNLTVHIGGTATRGGAGQSAGQDGVLAGSADAVAERLVAFTRLGFSAFNFKVTGPDEPAQLHVLATEVIPAVRAAAGG